jgi:uncharacterized protein
MPVSQELLDILACPKCKGDLHLTAAKDIPIMLIEEAQPLK